MAQRYLHKWKPGACQESRAIITTAEYIYLISRFRNIDRSYPLLKKR